MIFFRRGARAALPGLALAAAAACAPAVPTAPPPPLTRVAPAEAAAALAEAEASIRTLRGLADVRLERADANQRLREAAVLALPGKLRLETLAFGGATVLILATDGERLAIYSLATQEFHHGRASARALAGLTGVAVDPRHLVRLMAGLPPLAFPAADPRSRLEPEGDGFAAESVEGAFQQRLRLDAGGGVVGGELRTAAGLVFTFVFEDPRQVGPRVFPFRLRLEQPGGGRVDLTYRSVELNLPVDDAVFSLPLPPGEVRVVDLDAVPPR